MYSRPGKKIFHLVFRSGSSFADLARASDGLLREGLKVLSGSLVADDGGSAHWCVFVETDRDDLGKDEVAALLKKAVRQGEVVVLGGDDTVVDESHFPLQLATGQRAYLLSEGVIRGMLSRVREVLGTGGDVVVCQEGEAVGRGDFEAMKDLLGGTLRARLAKLTGLYLAVGIGVPDVVELDLEAQKGVVRVYENIECVGAKSRVPYSQWVRGHLAGVTSALFGVRIKCEETKCVACGDPYCEFAISRTGSNA